VKSTKTEGSIRAVPLQEIALEALEQLPSGGETDLLFPSPRGSYFDLHNFRKPQLETSTTRRRDHATPACLRSAPHLRDLRAPCRHLNL
jgi:hypothetical protein